MKSGEKLAPLVFFYLNYQPFSSIKTHSTLLYQALLEGNIHHFPIIFNRKLSNVPKWPYLFIYLLNNLQTYLYI